MNTIEAVTDLSLSEARPSIQSFQLSQLLVFMSAFLRKTIRAQGLPEKVTIDQSRSNTAAIIRYDRMHKAAIIIQQAKYLNNIVAQDQRAIKRVVRPMLGFKWFWAARCTIAGIEVMHAIRKGQLETAGDRALTPAKQFYALAA
jgi:putative transposase